MIMSIAIYLIETQFYVQLVAIIMVSGDHFWG